MDIKWVKTLCFYHRADLDGICSAAIVNKFVQNVDFYGIDYGDRFPWELISKYKRVIMVDWSLEPIDELIELSEKTNLTCIDHHKSTVERYEANKKKLKGKYIIKTGKAGCELAWEYFTSRFSGYDSKMPLAVYFIGRYDVWDIKADKKILPFQYGLRAKVNGYDDEIWKELLSDGAPYDPYLIVEEGNAILRYNKKSDKMYCDLYGYEVMFEKHKAFVINRGGANSTMFESKFDNGYKLYIAYVKNSNNRWRVSLYSTKIDCSKLATRYDGGGHAGAAGFVCDKLPWKQVLKGW